MDSNNPNLQGFKFVDETNWFNRFAVTIVSKFSAVLGATDTLPPVQGSSSRTKVPSISILGKGIGLDDPSSLKTLSFHQRRLTLRIFAQILVNLPLLAAILTTYLNALTESTKYLSLPVARSLADFFLSSQFSFFMATTLFIFLPVFVLAGVIFRLTATLIDKYFADSLCVKTIIYLVVELSREDTLSRPGRRTQVLTRINELARNTLLLPLRFSSKSDYNRNWVQGHFRNMESYIRERERWVIAPQENTLSALRQDFYRLIPIYLSGKYGEFTWIELPASKESPALTWKHRFATSLPRFIGYISPLIGLGFFLWRRSQLESLGISANIVTLILVAWFLLTIDTVLKLGIVSGLVNLAKGIKELK